MRLLAVSLRDFRCYERVEASFGEGLTVVSGPNGAGKTNLLEAIYVGCTGRSPRTAHDRQLVRFGAPLARVALRTLGEDGPHELAVGVLRSGGKQLRVDGAAVERLLDTPVRPLVSVFMPERLELVKGAPALRRAHLDQFVAALWPARSHTRRAYGQALAQRNALLARIRAGRAAPVSLRAWDVQLGRLGTELMADRRRAVDDLAGRFPRVCERLALDGEAAIAYRPCSSATSAEGLASELQERVVSDLARGFTGHGPHRDELLLLHRDRELRTYGSQGQQRLALLALLLAERESLAERRGLPPLILLDDVMSELDVTRRQALIDSLRGAGGQAVITTADPEQVPGAEGDVRRLGVRGGMLLGEAAAA